MACGLNNGAMKHSCRTTQFARIVTLKLNQKSTASTFAKETQKVTPTLWTLLPRQIGFCLVHVKKASRSLICVHFPARLGTRFLVGGGPEVFLVADAIKDGFHFGPGTYGSKLYPDPRRREVGWGFCSVTADLELRTGAYGPVTLDNATVPVAELFAVIFLVERSVGPIHIHSDCKYVRADKNKHTQRTIRGAHVTLRTRLQQALSRHPGTVETS